MPDRELISKEFGDRLAELLQSLQVIRDSLEGLRNGRAYQAIPLSGQLRAILADPSTKTTPLLLDVATTLSRELHLFAMPGADQELPLAEEPLLHVAGPPFTSERQFTGQVEMTWPEILDLPLVKFREVQYSVKEIIGFFANQAGGAHYATRVPRDLHELLALRLGSVQVLQHALAQIGHGALNSGASLVREVADLNLFFHFGVAAARAGVLAEWAYPGTEMRLTLGLDQQTHLVVVARGIEGQSVAVRLPDPLPAGTSHFLHIALRLGPDLGTTLAVSIDGTVPSEIQVDDPVFFANTIQSSEFSLGRALSGVEPGLPLAVGQHLAVGPMSPLDLARTLVWLSEQNSDSHAMVVSLGEGASGYRPLAQSSIEFTGDVRHVPMSTALQA